MQEPIEMPGKGERITRVRLLDRWPLTITCLCLIAIALFVFRDYIVLKKVYLFKDIGSDTIDGLYPQLVQLSNYLKTTGIPAWSFNQGAGQNIFPFSINDPFKLLLILLPTTVIAYALVFMETIKILLAGIFFFLYIRTLTLSSYAAIVGALLYGFSGYIILGGAWYTFSLEALYCALLLYAFELYLKRGIWLCLPIAIALIASFQPFLLYLYSLLLLLYGSLRFIEEQGFHPRDLSLFILKLLGWGALGTAMSSFFLFSEVAQILESPRLSSDATYFKTLISGPLFATLSQADLGTAILRYFSSDLLGTGSFFRESATTREWWNYLEAPLGYAGVLSLLIAPQLFTFADRRQKALYATALFFCLTPIIFPYFRHAFWLFSGDYFRTFSLFTVIFILFCAVHGMAQLERGRINLPLLVVTLLVLSIALFFPYFPGAMQLQLWLKMTVFGLLLVYSALLGLSGVKRLNSFARIALVVTVVAELAFFSSITVNNRPVITAAEIESKVGYNDYTVEAVAWTKAHDHDFYRIIKDYSSGLSLETDSLNDGMAQDYKGTSCYVNFNNLWYFRFLEALEVIPPRNQDTAKWLPGIGDRPLLQIITGVRYCFSKKPAGEMPPLYAPVKTIGDVQIGRNRLALPLGFTYRTFVPSDTFMSLDKRAKDKSLLKGAVIDTTQRTRLTALAPISIDQLQGDMTFGEAAVAVEGLRRDTLTIVNSTQNSIRGRIVAQDDELLFLSIPYDRGWHARVDGKEVELERVNIGFTGLMLARGEHTVEMFFIPPFMRAGLLVSLAALFLYLLLFGKQMARRKNR